MRHGRVAGEAERFRKGCLREFGGDWEKQKWARGPPETSFAGTFCAFVVRIPRWAVLNVVANLTLGCRKAEGGQ